MNYKYIDIHTHKPLNNNRSNNVLEIYNLSLNDIQIFAQTSQLEDTRKFSAGLHPWWVDGLKRREIDYYFEQLEALTKLPNFCFVGETGLDKISAKKNNNAWEGQIEIFQRHIELAITIKSPLIIHCVRAYSEVYSQLKNNHFSGPVILHDFNGNEKTVDQFMQLDTYFSYGDKLFRPESKGHKSMSSIPKGRILYETDDTEYSIQEIIQKSPLNSDNLNDRLRNSTINFILK